MALLFYKNAGLIINYRLLLFVFFSTVFIYTFQRFGKLKINLAFSGPRLAWMLNNLTFVVLVLCVSGIGAIFLAIKLQWVSLLILSPLAVIAFLYVGKFPFNFPFNLRDIPFAKAHFIALTWAGITVVLPMTEAGLKWTNQHQIFFAAAYLFILSLAVVFDIRDLSLDEPEKKTVPQIIGATGALIVSCSLLALSFVLFFVAGNYDILPFFALLLLNLTFVINSINKKDDLYYSFYLDGLIVLTCCALAYMIN